MTKYLFAALMWLLLGYVLYLVVKEDIYQEKRRKLVVGAIFSSKVSLGGTSPHEVEVVSLSYDRVRYHVVGDYDVRDTCIREFIKTYIV